MIDSNSVEKKVSLQTEQGDTSVKKVSLQVAQKNTPKKKISFIVEQQEQDELPDALPMSEKAAHESHDSMEASQYVQDETQQSSESKEMLLLQNKHTTYQNTYGYAEEKKAESKINVVKRSRLIGGADVVWIEPKPKDSENTFGEPPM